ncbi:MAG TPA: radical SAM protein [Gemmatimonadaceae bacterium]|nr:radical SAM protein [Gemmatimonadaceae bacterium]
MPKLEQQPLFGTDYERKSRMLPMLEQQKDITYWSSPARSVLNGPETTGMGFWSINPYVGCAFGCAYCYARYAHRYVMERAAASERMAGGLDEAFRDMPPWLAFERNIFVKKNAPEVLRRTLRQGSDKHLNLLKGEAILIGSATDPYQPAERRFRITRGILETIAEHEGLRIVIITKSPLITRDVDLLTRISRRSDLSVHISLITLNRELARRLEPRAPTPEARLRALERLRKADIDTSINCMPVLPGITDDPADLDALVKRVAEGGATRVAACALRLQSAARARYLPFIEQQFPHLAARYRRAYARDHEVSAGYRKGLSEFFERTCTKYGVRGSWRVEDDADEGLPESSEEQLALLG